MSTWDDLLKQLGTVIDELDAGSERVGAAFFACEESHQALAHATEGTATPEANEVVGSLSAALGEIAEVRRAVNSVRERVTAYASSLGAPSPSRECSIAPKPQATSSHRPSNPVGTDGSEYPPDAAWAVPELPARVRGGGDRTVAKLKIHGRPVPGEFRSGQRDRWSGEAATRMRSLRVDMPDYLAHHVEIRAAAMMIEVGIRSATIAMNNVPCGYQTPPPGCHQLLEAFLPAGSNMTVQGTDRQGRPYQRTYHGKAER